MQARHAGGHVPRPSIDQSLRRRLGMNAGHELVDWVEDQRRERFGLGLGK